MDGQLRDCAGLSKFSGRPFVVGHPRLATRDLCPSLGWVNGWLASHPRLANLCPSSGPVGCGWPAIRVSRVCVQI